MVGILKKIFTKNKKIERDDPVFGHVEYERSHGVDMWLHAPSDDKDHMIVVFASATGPSQAQRDFYDSLRRDIVSLESSCKEFISRQQDPPANLSDMMIYSVEIGDDSELENGQFVIELSDQEPFGKQRFTYFVKILVQNC